MMGGVCALKASSNAVVATRTVLPLLFIFVQPRLKVYFLHPHLLLLLLLLLTTVFLNCKKDIGDGAWGHKYHSPEHGPIHHVKFFYDKSHLSLPQS